MKHTRVVALSTSVLLLFLLVNLLWTTAPLTTRPAARTPAPAPNVDEAVLPQVAAFNKAPLLLKTAAVTNSERVFPIFDALELQFDESERVFQRFLPQRNSKTYTDGTKDARLFNALGGWYWFPVLFPALMRRVGSMFDGGKYTTTLATLAQLPTAPCIVYSFGSNGQVDFELALLETAPHCVVYIFDYSMHPDEMPEAARSHPRIFFFQAGLGRKKAAVDLEDGRTVLVASIYDYMRELGHSYVDIVKIDVEDSEYDVMKTLFVCGSSGVACELPFGEVLMELHLFIDRQAELFRAFDAFETSDFRHVSLEANWPSVKGTGDMESGACVEVVWVKRAYWRVYAVEQEQRKQQFDAVWAAYLLKLASMHRP